MNTYIDVSTNNEPDKPIRGTEALELSDQIELDGYCTVCGNPSKWVIVFHAEPEANLDAYCGSECCGVDISHDKDGQHIAEQPIKVNNLPFFVF